MQFFKLAVISHGVLDMSFEFFFLSLLFALAYEAIRRLLLS